MIDMLVKDVKDDIKNNTEVDFAVHSSIGLIVSTFMKNKGLNPSVHPSTIVSSYMFNAKIREIIEIDRESLFESDNVSTASIDKELDKYGFDSNLVIDTMACVAIAGIEIFFMEKEDTHDGTDLVKALEYMTEMAVVDLNKGSPDTDTDTDLDSFIAMIASNILSKIDIDNNLMGKILDNLSKSKIEKYQNRFTLTSNEFDKGKDIIIKKGW